MNKPGRRRKKKHTPRTHNTTTDFPPAIFRGKMRKNRAHVQLRPYDPKAARLTRLQIEIFIIRVCQRVKGRYLTGRRFRREGERLWRGLVSVRSLYRHFACIMYVTVGGFIKFEVSIRVLKLVVC